MKELIQGRSGDKTYWYWLGVESLPFPPHMSTKKRHKLQVSRKKGVIANTGTKWCVTKFKETSNRHETILVVHSIGNLHTIVECLLKPCRLRSRLPLVTRAGAPPAKGIQRRVILVCLVFLRFWLMVSASVDTSTFPEKNWERPLLNCTNNINISHWPGSSRTPITRLMQR